MKLYEGDCLKIMKTLETGSVDMVLCDLPYGTTQNKWDSIIPLEPLWREYWRLLKPNGAVVLTAAQPFTSALVMSQLDKFKYDWSWVKSRKTGQLNAKKRPLVSHETVLVFARGTTTYHPYTENVNPLAGSRTPPTKTENYGSIPGQNSYTRPDMLTKNSVLMGFDVGLDRGFHPTQKPVALMEYLIRTYTDDGETVLDNTMGSGTTGVACKNSGRKFIGIERDSGYFSIAKKRIESQAPVLC